MRLDYTLSIKEKAPYQIDWTLIEGSFKHNEGNWRLKTLPDGGTLVTYKKHVDGGLILPDFLVNRQLKKTMIAALDNLDKALNK